MAEIIPITKKEEHKCKFYKKERCGSCEFSDMWNCKIIEIGRQVYITMNQNKFKK